MKYAIYALVDPTMDSPDEGTFYVGETMNIQRRFIEHLTYRGDNLELNARIATLAVRGYLPICKTLEVVEGDSKLAHQREARHRGQYSWLYNR